MSKEGIDCIKSMLEKNRSKRPNLEEILKSTWFAEYRTVNGRDGQVTDANKFKAYALTSPDSPKIQQEIRFVQDMQD